MAEVSGLAIGVISLASLFSTCIDLFERVELGVNHRADYELGCTKLCLLKARLRDCRERLSDDTGRAEDEKGRQQVRHEDQIAISRCLSGIKRLFENAALLEDKYRPSPVRTDSHDLLALTLPKQTLRHKRFARISIFSSYPDQASIRKRAAWAAYDKAKLDTLLGHLEFLIRNLESVMPSTSTSKSTSTLKTSPISSELLRSSTIGRLDISQSLTLLSGPESQNIADSGVETDGADSDSTKQRGSEYSGNIDAKGFSSVHQGDVGFSPSHVFRSEVSTKDNAFVQQGNRSADFELERLKMIMSLQLQLQETRRNQN